MLRVVSLALGVWFWDVASTRGWHAIVNFANVPTPIQVWNEWIVVLGQAHFYMDIGMSLLRIVISFGLASALGIIIGLGMGMSRLVRDIVGPYIEILRPIPAVAWIPLAIIMWPTNESSIVFITFLGAFFPIALSTMHGVEQTPDLLVRAARTLGAGQRAVIRHVVLPAALPSILSGLAIGMGVSWFSLLAGEIVSGRYGIGYFTWKAYELIQYPDIIIGMLTIGLLGTLSTALIRLLGRPLLRWQNTQAKGDGLWKR
ncbi:MAG: ABC transporter permease [Acidiferrobacter sp.]